MIYSFKKLIDKMVPLPKLLPLYHNVNISVNKNITFIYVLLKKNFGRKAFII